jgi:PAS domain S-box-containing protein
MSQTLGYSREELIGMSFRDYMTPESADKIYDIFIEIYNTGEPAK